MDLVKRAVFKSTNSPAEHEGLKARIAPTRSSTHTQIHINTGKTDSFSVAAFSAAASAVATAAASPDATTVQRVTWWGFRLLDLSLICCCGVIYWMALVRVLYSTGQSEYVQLGQQSGQLGQQSGQLELRSGQLEQQNGQSLEMGSLTDSPAEDTTLVRRTRQQACLTVPCTAL